MVTLLLGCQNANLCRDVNTCTTKLLPQDFYGTTEPFWPVNCTRPSSAQALILKAITPCMVERSGYVRLEYNILLHKSEVKLRMSINNKDIILAHCDKTGKITQRTVTINV